MEASSTRPVSFSLTMEPTRTRKAPRRPEKGAVGKVEAGPIELGLRLLHARLGRGERVLALLDLALGDRGTGERLAVAAENIARVLSAGAGTGEGRLGLADKSLVAPGIQAQKNFAGLDIGALGHAELDDASGDLRAHDHA